MSFAQTFESQSFATYTQAPINYPIELGRAWRAFRRLVADKEDTRQVFEIMRALAGRSFPKGYQRLLETTEGGRQAALAVELADLLEDRAWLESFAEGSVGAAYRAFIAPRALSAYGLAADSRKLTDADIDIQHPVAWYARRLRDVHDVWHVLTGYGTDALGEACVVAFSYPQTGSLGFVLIAGGAAYEFGRLPGGGAFAKAIWQAYRHGRDAAWLPAVDYEVLFRQPLDVARERLGISRPIAYEAVPVEARDAGFGSMQ
jgi:ubiquinone biosynthesis protein COQ4